MSNFVHKVKDAMTDHDKPVTRSQTTTNPNQARANPFTSGSGYDRPQNHPQMGQGDTDPGFNRPGNTGYGTAPDSKAQTMQYGDNPRGATTASEPSQPSSDIRHSTFSPQDSSSSATSSSDMNAGPHQSKLANKLDPRVDSNAGNRVQQAPPTLQRENVGNQGMNPSNMQAQQQGLGQGMDSHSSTEDTFNKSTQEHRHNNQPTQFGFDGNQGVGESQEDFSTSTQEQKSHKATSHMSPCGGMGNEQMSENTAAQPGFGGNTAQAGGSSYNQNAGARGPERGQDTAMLQKPGMGADTNLQAGQQNVGGDQRMRY